MKKAFFTLFVLCVAVLPIVSHAQGEAAGFGSPLDVFRFPATCSIPPFVPSCNLVDETDPTGGSFISLATDIAASFFDMFIMLQVLGMSFTSGWLAIPVELTLPPEFSPSPLLAPGMQTLGTVVPAGPVGGIWIPPFYFTVPPQVPCIPPTVTVAPGLCCFRSMCIPVVTPIATVTPYTGASQSFFGSI